MGALDNTVLRRIIHRQVRTIVTQKDGRLAVNFPGAWEKGLRGAIAPPMTLTAEGDVARKVSLVSSVLFPLRVRELVQRQSHALVQLDHRGYLPARCRQRGNRF